MTTAQPPQRPDPSRSGAVWVTGMGAFLLLAAAAVFTAVRWDQIPDAAKLATLVAATGGFLIAGRTLRPTLPATAGALFHLGAFLVPIDVAAIGVRAELDWSSMLLAQGLVATATFWWAAASERSIVLRWATGAATVALAGGIGATTAVPAPLVLAAFAVAALVAGRPVVAIAWAALAGAAPLLAGLDRTLVPGAGTFDVLGLTGDQPRAAAVLSGALAAAVLGAVGRRRGDIRLALLGVAVGVSGAVVTWTGTDHSRDADLVGLAAAFALAQLVALATARDPFWHQPARVVANVADVVAFPGMLLLALSIAFVDAVDPNVAVAVAAGTLGIGWLAADARSDALLAAHRSTDAHSDSQLAAHRSADAHSDSWLAADRSADAREGRARTVLGMAVAGSGSVAWSTGSGVATAAALLGIAAVASAAPQRRGASTTAVLAAVAAPLIATSSVLAAGAAGVIGTVLITEAAVRRSHQAAAGSSSGATRGEADAWLLAITAIAPAGLAAAEVIARTGAASATLASLAVLAAAVAAQADRGRDGLSQSAPADPSMATGPAPGHGGPSATVPVEPSTTPGPAAESGMLWTAPLGTVARIAGVSVLSGVGALRPVEAGVVALVVAVLSLVDAARLGRPAVALGAAVALPVAVVGFSLASGLLLATTGVALTVAAAVVAGLASQLGTRWLTPALTAVGLCVGAGLVLAAGDAAAFADALIVTGGIGLAAGIASDRLGSALVSGVIITAGTWLRLADGDVAASEPYLLPVTVLLLVSGMHSRNAGASSWIAYGPAVGLLGGSSLVERLAGGAGWHAVVAGGVGVAAVAVGGARRLAAPLLLGSAVLVVLVGYETLAVTTGLPTWTWLALGGVTLLGAGVAMERHDVGPLETGRRLVDVVSDRFS